MHTEILVTTISCDLRGCKAEISGKCKYWPLYDQVKAWGWRRVLSSSPLPKPSIWAITLHFCPQHASVGDHPERFIIGGNGKAPSYSVSLAGMPADAHTN